MNDGNICLADCATTHTILREKKYFLNLIVTNAGLSTIFGTSYLIKDICNNGYHIATMNEGNKESLYITSIIYGKNIVAEKLLAFSSGLYHTT